MSFLFFSLSVKGAHNIPAGCPNGPALPFGQPQPSAATCQAVQQFQQQQFQQQQFQQQQFQQQNMQQMNLPKVPMGPPGGGMMGSPMGGPMGPPGGGMMGSPMAGPGGPMGGPGGPMGGPGGPLIASGSAPGAPRPGFAPPGSVTGSPGNVVSMAPSFSRNFVSQMSPSSGVSLIRQSPLR